MGFSLFGKNKQAASDTGTDAPEGKATPRRRKKGAEEPVDPVLPEKKRARRRLVGAATMVLAAIIGLPMLMESEPQALPEDVQIYIPSIDKPATETAVAPPAPPVAAAAPSEAAAQESQVGASTSAPASTPAPAVAERPAETVPSAPQLAAEKPAPEEKPKTQAQAPKTEVPKAEAPKAPPATATASSAPSSSTLSEREAQMRAILEGRNVPLPAAAKTTTEAQPGKFVLQVAALGSEVKAKELQDKLGKSGIVSYTEKIKVNNGEQIRVRVGPFASREEADKMRSRLSEMGLSGMVMPI